MQSHVRECGVEGSVELEMIDTSMMPKIMGTAVDLTAPSHHVQSVPGKPGKEGTISDGIVVSVVHDVYSDLAANETMEQRRPKGASGNVVPEGYKVQH